MRSPLLLSLLSFRALMCAALISVLVLGSGLALARECWASATGGSGSGQASQHVVTKSSKEKEKDSESSDEDDDRLALPAPPVFSDSRFEPVNALLVAGRDRVAAGSTKLRANRDVGTNLLVEPVGLVSLREDSLLVLSKNVECREHCVEIGRNCQHSVAARLLQLTFDPTLDKWRSREVDVPFDLAGPKELLAESPGSVLIQLRAGLFRLKLSNTSEVRVDAVETVITDATAIRLGMPSFDELGAVAITQDRRSVVSTFTDCSAVYRYPLDPARRTAKDVELLLRGKEGGSGGSPRSEELSKGDDESMEHVRPLGISTGKDGSVYVGDVARNRVIRIDPNGHRSVLVNRHMWPGVDSAYPFALSVANDELFVSEAFGNRSGRKTAIIAVPLDDPTQLKRVGGILRGTAPISDHRVDALTLVLRDVSAFARMPNGDLAVAELPNCAPGRIRIIESKVRKNVGPYSVVAVPKSVQSAAPKAPKGPRRTKAEVDEEVTRLAAELEADGQQQPAAKKRSGKAKSTKVKPKSKPKPKSKSGKSKPQTKSTKAESRPAKQWPPAPPLLVEALPQVVEDDDSGEDWLAVKTKPRKSKTGLDEDGMEEETAPVGGGGSGASRRIPIDSVERNAIVTKWFNVLESTFYGDDDCAGSFDQTWKVHRGKHAFEGEQIEIEQVLKDPTPEGTPLEIMRRIEGRFCLRKGVVRQLAKWIVFHSDGDPAVRWSWRDSSREVVELKVSDVRDLALSPAAWRGLPRKVRESLRGSAGRTGFHGAFDGSIRGSYGFVALVAINELTARPGIVSVFPSGLRSKSVLPFDPPAEPSRMIRLLQTAQPQVSSDEQEDSSEGSSTTDDPPARIVSVLKLDAPAFKPRLSASTTSITCTPLLQMNPGFCEFKEPTVRFVSFPIAYPLQRPAFGTTQLWVPPGVAKGVMYPAFIDGDRDQPSVEAEKDRIDQSPRETPDENK